MLGNKKYLPAFTLYELIIVMVLSSILTGIAFYAYSNLQQQLVNYDTYTNQSIEVLRLHTLLQRDASQSYEKQIIDNQWVFKQHSHTIIYHFHDNFIVRQVNIWEDSLENPMDTFSIKSVDVNNWLEKDDVAFPPFTQPIEYLGQPNTLVIPN